MKHHLQLREVAKFLSGFIAAEFFKILWLYTHNFSPIHTFGVTYTEGMVLPALLINATFFVFLIHYGWHLGKIPRIREHSYLVLAGIIFTIIAAAHLLRAFFGLPIELAGIGIPVWLSWLGTAVAAYLAYASFTYAARGK